MHQLNRPQWILAAGLALCLSQAFASEQPKPASSYTKAMNAAVYQQLPFNDRQDYLDAERGFIGTIAMPIKTGETVNWDLRRYDFLKGDQVPDTVNPSLWRNAQLNLINGLFKVTDLVYQIRGLDLANMTIIEGNSGILVIDPLMSAEVAKAGLDLYYQHRPKKPVVAVIYTHSHADHYAGVKGVVSQAEVDAGKVKVIAPEGFLKESVSENVFAGNAMARRSLYQFGALLAPSARGQVDGGLGKTDSMGSMTLIAPTVSIQKTGEKLVVDGVKMEFQMAPGTEAPAEMLVWFPQFKVLDAAEDVNHTMHNLSTLRGAQVRDAASWWKTLDTTIARYGDKVEFMVAQHQWPAFSREQAVRQMEDQRDMIKYLHDQSLNLINQGYTMTEVAARMRLPDSIGKKWYNRGYYGSVSHNSKGVYQRYLGWYSSDPSDLNPLPPEQAGQRYVAAMGGADAVLKQGQQAIARGEYRWAAQLLKNLVFSDPKNQAARNLEADALEQLGYQTENAIWRNQYLMGAYELRNPISSTAGQDTASPDTLAAMTPEQLLDFTGIRLDGAKADGKRIGFNWKLPNGDKFAIQLENSVLLYRKGEQLDHPDVTLKVDKVDLARLLNGETTLSQEVLAGHIEISGQTEKLNELLTLLDHFEPMFPIVTP